MSTSGKRDFHGTHVATFQYGFSLHLSDLQEQAFLICLFSIRISLGQITVGGDLFYVANLPLLGFY